MTDAIDTKPSFEELLIQYDNGTEPTQKSFSGLLNFVKEEWNISTTALAGELGIPIGTTERYINSNNTDLKPESTTLYKINEKRTLSQDSINRLRRVSLGDGNDISILTEQAIDKLKETTDEHEKNRVIIAFFKDCLAAEGFTLRSFGDAYGTSKANINKLLQYNLENLKGSLSQVQPNTAKRLASCFTTDKNLAEKMANVFLKKEIESKKSINALLSEARGKIEEAASDLEKKRIVAEFFDKSVIAMGHDNTSFGNAYGFARSQISAWRNPDSKLSLYNTNWIVAKRLASALAEGEDDNKNLITDTILLIKGISEKTTSFHNLMAQVEKGKKTLSQTIIQFRTQEIMPEADFAKRFGIDNRTLRKIEKGEEVEPSSINKLIRNINDGMKESEKIPAEKLEEIVGAITKKYNDEVNAKEEEAAKKGIKASENSPKDTEEYVALLGEKTKPLNTIQIESLVVDIQKLAKESGLTCKNICHILKDKELQLGIIELKRHTTPLILMTQHYNSSELAEKLSAIPISELGRAVNELYDQYLNDINKKKSGTIIHKGSNPSATRVNRVYTIDNHYMDL